MGTLTYASELAQPVTTTPLSLPDALERSAESLRVISELLQDRRVLLGVRFGSERFLRIIQEALVGDQMGTNASEDRRGFINILVKATSGLCHLPEIAYTTQKFWDMQLPLWRKINEILEARCLDALDAAKELCLIPESKLSSIVY